MQKMIALLLLACSFSVHNAVAQDHPDYRSKKDLFQRVREPDFRGELASFTMAGLDESMGKVPPPAITLTELGNRSISFEGDHIKVSIKSIPFVKESHKLWFYESYDEKKYLLRIDNKPFYGKSYGKVPAFGIGSVTVLIDNDTVPVPAEAYADIYDFDFAYNDNSGVLRSLNRVYASKDGKTYYIYLIDRNAGGTEVTWIIRDKKFVKRVLDFGFIK